MLEGKITFMQSGIHISPQPTVPYVTKLAVGGIISWYQEPGSIINHMCPFDIAVDIDRL